MTIDHRKVVTLTTYQSPYVEIINNTNGYQVTDTVTRYTKPVYLIDYLFEDAAFDLKLASSLSLTDSVSGNNLITFSRAGSGTYVDSSGVIQTATTDAPRFDHDPVTRKSLGLLIEESRTNIIDGNTSNFNSIWTNATPSGAYNNAGIAPDGTNTAFSTTAYDGDVRGQKNYVITADTRTYTFSIFIKSTGGQGQYVTYQTGINGGDQDSQGQVAYDFATDTVAHGYSRKIYANGWVRIWKTYTNSNSGLFLVTNGSATSLDMLFWGAQVEIGSYPSSLIVTPDVASVTRAPDLASITGTNFSSWYNNSEGTIFTDISPLDKTSGRGYLFSNGTDNHRLGHNTSENNGFALFMYRTAITSLASAPSGMPKPIKTCLAYKPGSSRGVIDGTLEVLSTATTVPNVINQVGIGCQNYESVGGFLNGHIKRLSYFSTRLPDEDLIKLTT